MAEVAKFFGEIPIYFSIYKASAFLVSLTEEHFKFCMYKKQINNTKV